MNEQKNLVIAIIVSVLIMVSFQFFWERPKIEKAKLQQQSEQLAATKPGQPQAGLPRAQMPATNTPATPSATPGLPTASPSPMPASSGLSAPGPAIVSTKPVITGPRITLDTPELQGSIALRGARIDDVILKKYRETIDANSDPIRLFSPIGSKGAYYAEHGWISSDSSIKLPTSNTLWKAEGRSLSPRRGLRLIWDNGQGLRFIRNISVDDHYMFKVVQEVENRGSKPVQLTPYALVNRTNTPSTLGFYILHEGPLGVFNGTLEEVDYDDLVDKRQIVKTTTGGWIGITDKYWLSALVPDQKTKTNMRFLHWKAGNKEKYQVDFVSPAVMIPAGGRMETTSHLFSGAKRVKILDDYSEKLGVANFDLAVDFGWFYFLTKPFFYLLNYLNSFLGNFGLAILGVTVLVKILFFPLANKSYRSMSQMKKLQPKLVKLKEQYKDDKQRLNQEMMKLYQREKVNPASSCLPVMIQIPVFFALYKVLFVSIDMRHTPFYGWIEDLSARDPTSFINLFGLLPYDVPGFVPEFISIGIWPLIMGGSMFLQMRLNPQPPDPVQARIFMLMPIFFTFIMAPFPAGLVMYWAWNNTLSMAQQWTIMRRMDKAEASK